MENLFGSIYQNYPQDELMLGKIREAMAEKNFEESTQKMFENYMTLMFDRFLTGHVITRMPEKYYNLVSRNSFSFVDELIDDISKEFYIEIPIEEKIFAFLPIIGMRTPADSKNMYSIELDEKIRPLLQKIVEQIRQELNISIDTHEFTEKFMYHIMFMINRLRYNVHIDNPMFEDIHYKYPLAFKMAEIAARVIKEDAEVVVTQAEMGYLAAYFGVFLEVNTLNQKQQKIAVISDKGRVTAQLFAVQIRKVVDSSSQLDILSPSEAVSGILDQYDIVICTTEHIIECECPVIYIHEIFDENELKNKLRQAKFCKGTDAAILDDNWYVMANILKEDTFFNKGKSNITYTNSNYFLVQLLKNTEYGSISSGFMENKYGEYGIKPIKILSSEDSVSFGYIKRSRDNLSDIAQEFISYLKEEITLKENE